MNEWVSNTFSIEGFHNVYLVTAIIKIFIAAIVILFLRRFAGRRVRTALTLFFIIYLFRIAVIMNPYAITYYLNVMEGGTKHYIGSMENFIIARSDYYAKTAFRDGFDFLAIGSSQSFNIYRYKLFINQYDSQLNRIPEARLSYTSNVPLDKESSGISLGLFSLPGFSIMDMVIYKDRIVTMRPKAVLLYVSDFDLNGIDWTRFMQSPTQGTELIDILGIITEHGLLSESREATVVLLSGEFFPEIKYSFISKLWLKKVITQLSTVGEKSHRIEKVSRELTHMRTINKKIVDFNLAMLNKFITSMEQASIDVFIVEGSYREDYRSDDYDFSVGLIRDRLVELARGHSNTRFIGLAEQYPSEYSSWNDPIHLKDISGFYFRSHLLNNHLIPYLKEKKINNE